MQIGHGGIGADEGTRCREQHIDPVVRAANSLETDLVKDALAVASEQRSADTVAHLKAETEALHKASTSKKCST
jgi:hypothetical protein